MKNIKSRLCNILIITIILCAAAIQTPEGLSAAENEIMVTTSADSGVGSLREAINQANSHLGPDVIHFNTSGFIISPLTDLPPITDYDTVIDASSNWSGSWPMGRPGITINGSNDTSGNPTGLRIVGAQNVTIKGLEIENFSYCVWLHNARNTTIGEGASTNGGGRMLIHSCSGPAVHIFGGQENKVIGSYIGTSDNGTLPEPNGGEGISILDSHHNAIGGLGAMEGNIIGASLYGIYISGSQSRWNTIDSNFIGTMDFSSGNTPNVYEGVFIGNGATLNAVGGRIYGSAGSTPIFVCLEFGNYIQDNGRNGVELSGLGNSYNGVMGNYIYGNQANGIVVTNQAQDNWIGCNTVADNIDSGIFIDQTDTARNTIDNNFIGIDLDNTAAPNGKHGIGLYEGTSENSVTGNYIGNNGWSGVAIIGISTSNNMLYLNHIGVGMNGKPMGNAFFGVDIIESPENLLTENVIANNGTAGSFAGVHIGIDTAVGNGLFRNSIYNNSGLGIQLTDRAQHEISAPVINSVNCPAVSGISGPIGARVDIFSDSSDEGRYYEGSATVNGQYQWTYFGRFRGPNLTAITFDNQTHDSSEFSAPWMGAGGCYVVYVPSIEK